MLGGPQGPGTDPQQIIKGILSLGQQVEQTLIQFARAMPAGAQMFQEANELIKQGIAAEVGAAGGGEGEQPPASSATNVGPEFPGGGFSGGRP